MGSGVAPSRKAYGVIWKVKFRFGAGSSSGVCSTLVRADSAGGMGTSPILLAVPSEGIVVQGADAATDAITAVVPPSPRRAWLPFAIVTGTTLCSAGRSATMLKLPAGIFRKVKTPLASVVTDAMGFPAMSSAGAPAAVCRLTVMPASLDSAASNSPFSFASSQTVPLIERCATWKVTVGDVLVCEGFAESA